MLIFLTLTIWITAGYICFTGHLAIGMLLCYSAIMTWMYVDADCSWYESIKENNELREIVCRRKA